jgi:C-terminal processing protease CtpA/Prc
MKLKLAPGDLITSIDGVKTAGLSAEAVSALMSVRAQHERSLKHFKTVNQREAFAFGLRLVKGLVYSL